MGHVIEHLPRQCEALSSNPSTSKIKFSFSCAVLSRMHAERTLFHGAASCFFALLHGSIRFWAHVVEGSFCL
jgi:hypothetical protein